MCLLVQSVIHTLGLPVVYLRKKAVNLLKVTGTLLLPLKVAQQPRLRLTTICARGPVEARRPFRGSNIPTVPGAITAEATTKNTSNRKTTLATDVRTKVHDTPCSCPRCMGPGTKNQKPQTEKQDPGAKIPTGKDLSAPTFNLQPPTSKAYER